jgi:hypothetical protein
MVPPFLETNQSEEIYCETPSEVRFAPKWMPSEEVGLRYIAIPSNSDIARIQTLSNKERELVDEIKWRITHQNNSWEGMEVLSLKYEPWNTIPSSSLMEDSSFDGYLPYFTDLRRGYENAGLYKRPKLRFEDDQDRFLYPRIAVFKLFEQWRAHQMKTHKEDVQFTENIIGPAVLELFKRYRHHAIDAFNSPILRDHVLLSMGTKIPERLFAAEIRKNRWYSKKAFKENWIEPDPQYVFSIDQVFWLGLMSDGVRDRARTILDSWWTGLSVLRTCMVCNRHFTLLDRWRAGAEETHLSEEFFDNLCLKCPIVSNGFTALRSVSKRILPLDESLFREAMQEYIDACGFVPMEPISPYDEALLQRIDKKNFVRFVKAWGGLGPETEGHGNESWLLTLLGLGVFPGEVIKTARGYMCVAEDGAHCRSLDEKIIDDLLSRLQIKHRHEPNYPYDKQFNRNQMRRADWKVGDVYVEFFGMMSETEYAEKASQKQMLAEKLG